MTKTTGDDAARATANAGAPHTEDGQSGKAVSLLARVILPRPGEPLDVRKLYLEESTTNSRRAHAINRTSLQIGAESDDDLLEKVVRERPGELHPGELHGDRARLGRTDPDRQHPLAVLLLQDHDRRVRVLVEAEVGDADFDHGILRCPDPRTRGSAAGRP